MPCPHRAVLTITRKVISTATEIARERIELSCGKPAGHDGPHHDAERDEHWEDRGPPMTHLFRQEADDEE
jgi:hypothetical protein